MRPVPLLCFLFPVLAVPAAPNLFSVSPYVQHPDTNAMSILFFTTADVSGTLGLNPSARASFQRKSWLRSVLRLTPYRSLKWPAREGGLGLRRTSGEFRLKPALQAGLRTAMLPTSRKKALARLGYATSAALAAGRRGPDYAVQYAIKVVK